MSDFKRFNDLINEILKTDRDIPQSTQWTIHLDDVNKAVTGVIKNADGKPASKEEVRNTLYFINAELARRGLLGFKFKMYHSGAEQNHFHFGYRESDANRALLETFFKPSAPISISSSLSVGSQDTVPVGSNTATATATSSTADCGLKVAIYKHPTDANKAVLDVSFKLPTQLRKEQLRKNVVFLLDRSGSMSENGALKLLKGFVEKIEARQLAADDSLSLVSFNHEAEVHIQTSPKATAKTQIAKVFDKMKADGSTDLLKPFTLLNSPGVLRQDTRNVTLFFTDGKHQMDNASQQERDGWKEMVDEIADRVGEHVLIPVGFGAGYSQYFMDALTRKLNMSMTIHVSDDADSTDSDRAADIVGAMLQPHSGSICLRVAGGPALEKGRLVFGVDMHESIVIDKTLLANNSAFQLEEAKNVLQQVPLASGKLKPMPADALLRWARTELRGHLNSDKTPDDIKKAIKVLQGDVEKGWKKIAITDTDKQGFLKLIEDALSGNENRMRAANFASGTTQLDYLNSQHCGAAQPLPSWTPQHSSATKRQGGSSDAPPTQIVSPAQSPMASGIELNSGSWHTAKRRRQGAR